MVPSDNGIVDEDERLFYCCIPSRAPKKTALHSPAKTHARSVPDALLSGADGTSCGVAARKSSAER